MADSPLWTWIIPYCGGCLLAVIFLLLDKGDRVTEGPLWVKLLSIPLWPLLLPFSFLALAINLSLGLLYVGLSIAQLIGLKVELSGRPLTTETLWPKPVKPAESSLSN